MVTTTVTVKFHNPSLSRRKEWQRAAQLYRDTKQFCIDGWENDDFDKSVTTASIDNGLYSAIQNQAIREAKADHQEDGAVSYRQSQPFALNNQNWEIDTTENGSVIVGFPCISGWWYTPIEVYDDVDDAVRRVLSGKADKTRLQVYRRGEDWFCTFNVEYDTNPDGETAIGVDVGHNNLLAAHAEDTDKSMLVSGREAKYIRRHFRSLRESLQEAGALRALNRADDKESRRIRDLNHTASRRLIDWIEQFENPVLRLEDLEGIRAGSDWRGVHSWHFHQLQEFIVYKAERTGVRVEKVDPEDTSQRCSVCDEYGTRDGDHFSCPSCGRERHSDLNGAENIAQREGEPCTA
ncbi:RNA-guided endonuclease InsQ/TnpB family protein [Halobacterium rubrum]|uniref:RNA-guided endonuclease InsQ/TnpB family protein n=1 Tax=Halobacterium TaxID=2239 RepID=UPI001F3B7FD0|nr:transposase [Halobacterium rubrum]MDH5018813.1 transposase [Halobacterium rubrum]